jgi:hypothetical protein
MADATSNEKHAESMPVATEEAREFENAEENEEKMDLPDLEGTIEAVVDPVETENATDDAHPDLDSKSSPGMEEPVIVSNEENTSREDNFDDREKESELTDTLTRFAIPQEQEHEIGVDISDESLEDPTSINHVPLFPTILFSNDRIHPETTTTKLLNSPKPPKNHDFVNVDFNADVDEFKLEMGLMMSRSGSIESLNFDTTELLFSKIDTDLEPPRIGTPTQEIKDSPVEDPAITENGPIAVIESGEQQEVEAKDAPPPEPEVNRDEVIKLICKDLEIKEKLNSKNTALQNKLAELFKRKRVRPFDFRVMIKKITKRVSRIKSNDTSMR